MLKRLIESVRLSTSFSFRQLLGGEVLGDVPGTEFDETDLFGHDRISEHPITITTFAGAGRHFPIIATAMILSTISTVFFLSALPLTASERLSTERTTVIASHAAATTSYSTPPMTPLQARVKYMQKLHEEFQRASVPSSISSDIQTEERSSETEGPLHTAAGEEEASSAHNQEVTTVSGSALFARSDNKQGVYLTASSVSRTEFFEKTIDSLLVASGSAIVVDVKGGSVLFHSAAPMAKDLELVRSLYELPEILKTLHERNIYVIGRFVAIKDAGFTGKMPETKIRDPNTGKVLTQTWVDPANETAIEYNMQVVCELAAAGIDEINLDYIRFSTAEFGALSVYSAEEKADRLEAFIKATRETIDRCGPHTRLGLSTFAILGWSYDINVATLGQDVVRFAPLVDVISPMAYPATFTSAGYYIPGKNPGPRNYYLVYRTLTGYADLLGPDHEHKIRPWIQGYGVGAKDITDQMRAVYDAGYCGFTVWSAGNNYAPVYSAMSADALKPDRCKDAQQVFAENE